MFLWKASSALTLDDRITVNRPIVDPYFNYWCLVFVWDRIGDTLANKLQRLQNRVAPILTDLSYTERANSWTLGLVLTCWNAFVMYRFIHHLAQPHMRDMFTQQLGSQIYNLWKSKLIWRFLLPKPQWLRTVSHLRGAPLRNALPDHVKQLSFLGASNKKKIKTFNLASTTLN